MFQLKDWRMIQEERAKRFYRTRTLRRFLLALLDHVTQERLVQWDRQELAQEHNNRSATHGSPICSLCQIQFKSMLDYKSKCYISAVWFHKKTFVSNPFLYLYLF